MSNIPVDCDLRSYRYDLPEERIAQQPAQRRDASRLMVVDRAAGEAREAAFAELAELLPPEALLVANNSRVVPARLYGRKDTGGRVEFLLLTPPPLVRATPGRDGWSTARVEGLLRASKAPKAGQVVSFGPDLRLVVAERGEFGRCRVDLSWNGHLMDRLGEQGHMPLPPYITRPDTPEDAERYQTVYNDEAKAGSMAAPTAGLHFTPGMRAALAGAGFGWAEVTLFVGYGTFSPVRERDIRNHRMHSEYVEVSRETAEAVNQAKAQGRPVVAVGTTSVRSLEGCVAERGRLEAWAGWTDMFIRPGYAFKAVDAMLTNFHLPESSLIIMVSALAGREAILDAYRKALEKGFRFFSYGDAMLIR